MMDTDEDEAPSLVDLIRPDTDSTAAQLQDLSLTKVPLTIVTGRLAKLDTQIRLLSYTIRVLRSRQDNAGQLHTEGTTWEEDSSHTKRLVYTMYPSTKRINADNVQNSVIVRPSALFILESKDPNILFPSCRYRESPYHYRRFPNLARMARARQWLPLLLHQRQRRQRHRITHGPPRHLRLYHSRNLWPRGSGQSGAAVLGG